MYKSIKKLNDNIANDINTNIINKKFNLIIFEKLFFIIGSSFNVIVKRKFTILKDNEPYVRDAMEQIKSIIDSKFGNVDDRFKNIQNII